MYVVKQSEGFDQIFVHHVFNMGQVKVSMYKYLNGNLLVPGQV